MVMGATMHTLRLEHPTSLLSNERKLTKEIDQTCLNFGDISLNF